MLDNLADRYMLNQIINIIIRYERLVVKDSYKSRKYKSCNLWKNVKNRAMK